MVSERTPESKLLKIGTWVKDRVLLIDLGYFKHHAFHLIDQQGGSFVSRLKKNPKPVITQLNCKVRGNSVYVVDMNVWEALTQPVTSRLQP